MTMTLADAVVTSFLIKDLKFHPMNPRHLESDDHAEVVELAESIRQNGLLQLPCVLEDGTVVAGETRIRALRRLKVKQVDCIVKSGVEAHAAVLALLAANRDARKPNALAEAATVNQLRKDGCTVEMICERLRVSRRWVAQREFLVNLSPKVRDAYEQRQSFIAHFTPEMLAAYAVLAVEEQEQDIPQWENAHSPLRSMKTVADVDKYVSNRTRVLGKACWNLDDAALLPKMGACSACPFQTLRAPDLFGEDAASDIKKARCLRAECFGEKTALSIARINEEKRVEDKGALIVVDLHAPLEVRGHLSSGSSKGSVVGDGDVEPAAKGAKGAVPATFLSAIGVVTNGYVKKKAKPKSSGKADSGDVEEVLSPVREKPAKERLADSMLAYARRRKAMVVDKVFSAIEGVKPQDVADGKEFKFVTWDLLIAYGADSRMDEDGNYHADLDLHHRRIASCVNQLGQVKVMWPRIQTGVLDDLRRSNPSQLDAEYDVAEWLCKGLNIGFSKFVDDAEADIPDPKSWERLRKEIDEAHVAKKDDAKKLRKTTKSAKKAKAKKKR